MIWATVSSWSCFCWLYRASPSLAAKNIINLIFIFMIWWSLCVVSSLMLLEEGVSNDQGILLAKPLLAFVVLHFVIQSQTCLLLQVSLEFLLLHSNPLWWKGNIFGVLVLECLVDLHRTIRLHLLQHYWLDIDLDYCDIEWLALETKSGHSAVFDIASKNCISHSFVDYEGYSISSKGFLPTEVDIMVIWVKFAHSSPF